MIKYERKEIAHIVKITYKLIVIKKYESFYVI